MKVWRVLFGFAALFNLCVGAAMIAGAGQVAAQMGVAGPAAGYIVSLAGLLVGLWGLAYAMVAWAPLPNRNLVGLGALGKASAAVLASLYALADAIADSIFVFGMADLGFALMFAVFLQQTRRATPSA